MNETDVRKELSRVCQTTENIAWPTFNTERETPVVPITRFRRSARNQELRYAAFIRARCIVLSCEIRKRPEQERGPRTR